MKYIATFYSHFGAVRFKKMCDGHGIEAKLMPVPRDLSSSCGTCVTYETKMLVNEGDKEDLCISDMFKMQGMVSDELEQIVCKIPAGYQMIYRTEG